MNDTVGMAAKCQKKKSKNKTDLPIGYILLK